MGIVTLIVNVIVDFLALIHVDHLPSSVRQAGYVTKTDLNSKGIEQK